MNEEDIEFLSRIGSTEEMTFNELCSGLGEDCPHDKDGWRELFQRLRELENQSFIDVTRTQGKIEGIQLTESGASLIRDRMDAKRGLLSLIN